jgi:hypothetical protein
MSPTLQENAGRLERGEIDSAQFLECLMRMVVARVGSARAGLRVTVDTPDGRAMRCVAMFDATADRLVSAFDMAHVDNGEYIQQLRRDGYVTLDRRRLDPRRDAVLIKYFDATAIGSSLEMGFSVNGILFGTFCCERVEPGDWTQRQVQALRLIAARSSLTLMHVVHPALATVPGALWEASRPHRATTLTDVDVALH